MIGQILCIRRVGRSSRERGYWKICRDLRGKVGRLRGSCFLMFREGGIVSTRWRSWKSNLISMKLLGEREDRGRMRSFWQLILRLTKKSVKTSHNRKQKSKTTTQSQSQAFSEESKTSRINSNSMNYRGKEESFSIPILTVSNKFKRKPSNPENQSILHPTRKHFPYLSKNLYACSSLPSQ